MAGKRKFGVVVGMPSYAAYLADLVNEHSTHWHLRAYDDATRAGTVMAALAIRRSDALITFGGPAPSVALTQVARDRGVPVIVIWAGSDVVTAASKPTLLQTVRINGYTHISDSPWLVDELQLLGIKAAYVPVTAVAPGPPVQEFPEQFRVLTYLPEPRRQFYGREIIYRAAHALPDVEFWVVGKGLPDPAAPRNVEFFGSVKDTTPHMDACAVLLRMPEHDGKSMFVLEALARARHVVWNHNFPHVHTEISGEGVIERLRELRSRHAGRTLPLNYEGREYALTHFGRAVIAAGFEKVLDTARARTATARSAPKLRVAVSGLPLFCAQLVDSARRHAPDVQVRVMLTDTRLQVLTALRTLAESDVWYIIGAPQQDRLLKAVSSFLRKPQVIHWAGSDILHLRDVNLRKRLMHPSYVHLAEADWTQRELRDMGIDAAIAALPVRYDGQVELSPLPQLFTVLLFVPLRRSEAYGSQEYLRLMQALRGEPVKYLVVGGGKIDVPDGVDAEHLGWREDLRKVYQRSSVLIRYTMRDGLSLMVLEALSFGRHVIWTQSLPHVEQVRSYDELEHTLRSMLAKHKRGELKLNTGGRKFATSEYAAGDAIGHLVDVWQRAARSGYAKALPGGRSLPRSVPPP